jgi:predicted glycosyltransferase
MGHPAHYHNVRVAADRLAEAGHRILFVAREKDVLFDLLDGCAHRVRYMSERRGAGKARLIAHVASRELKMLACALAFGPDVLVGTDIVITHVAKLLNRKSLVLNEDDASEVPLLARYGFRYATALLAPACCDQSPFNGKKIGYR